MDHLPPVAHEPDERYDINLITPVEIPESARHIFRECDDILAHDIRNRLEEDHACSAPGTMVEFFALANVHGSLYMMKLIQ